jgi:hypothetical protein
MVSEELYATSGRKQACVVVRVDMDLIQQLVIDVVEDMKRQQVEELVRIVEMEEVISHNFDTGYIEEVPCRYTGTEEEEERSSCEHYKGSRSHRYCRLEALVVADTVADYMGAFDFHLDVDVDVVEAACPALPAYDDRSSCRRGCYPPLAPEISRRRKRKAMRLRSESWSQGAQDWAQDRTLVIEERVTIVLLYKLSR